MIDVLLQLLRPKLAILNGIAAASGCLLMPGTFDARFLFVAFGGVALLAAGGSALNQVLEVDLDCQMKRTRLRPLPQGQLTPTAAITIGVMFIVTGFALIFAVGGLLPAMLAVVALAWYLVVYTPLKRHTSFAVAIGGICGALPPVIGWTLVGGNPADFRIVLLAGLFYLWQVPHFWLLLQRHEIDYRNVGIELPGNSKRCGAFMGIWITALAVATMLLPVFGIMEIQAALLLSVLFLLPLVVMAMLRAEKALFYSFNMFPLLLTVIIGIQKYKYF